MKTLFVIAFAAFLLLGVGLGFEQSFTPVPYNFHNNPGYNTNGYKDTLYKNNNVSGHPKGQIQLNEYSTLKMGANPDTTYVKYGNNLIVRNDSTDNFIYFTGTPAVSIGAASANYWQNGDGSKFTPPVSPTGMNPFENVTYSSAVPLSNPVGVSGEVNCSNSIYLGNKGGDKHPKILPSQADTTCEQRYEYAYQLSKTTQFQLSYDASKAYIENCANDYGSWKEFSSASSANFNRSQNLNRYAEFREWLKKVLYFNTKDSAYYCSDVWHIMGTFNWFDSVRGHDHNGAIAVGKFLLETNKCPGLKWELEEGWKGSRTKQLEYYYDTVKDTHATPIDTTIPTLEELGLGILRGQQGAVGEAARGKKGIALFLAETNPFSDETTLRVETSDALFFKIEIFDILGRQLYTVAEDLYSAGEHRIRIDGKSLPHGMLYARLQTLSGEVRTIQLRHQ